MFNKVCDWFTSLMMLWVLLLCGVGFMWPGALTWMKPYLDYFFMFTMLGIGFVLNPEDFTPVFRKPLNVLLGSIAQFAIMPFLGWAIAKALNLPAPLALGLIMAGSAPGAMASNVISYLAKADVAYSIAVTTTTTFLAPVMTPALVLFYGSIYIKMDFWPMFRSILIMVIIPLIIGFIIKRFAKKQIEKIAPLFPAISTLFIAFIIGLVLALNKKYLMEVNLVIFAAVALHNFFGLALGYLAAVLYRFNEKMRRTLSFEVGMQNAGLGAVLALKHLSAEAALPNALFAVWCVITASILANIWSKRPV